MEDQRLGENPGREDFSSPYSRDGEGLDSATKSSQIGGGGSGAYRWSMALGGCGVQTGAVIGATNDKGTEVVDHEVHGGHLFHTYLQALGIDSTANHDIDGREIPIGDPAVEPIKELLA